VTISEARQHSYPADHWRELRRFSEGNELDPKGAFRLSADTWDARAYSDNGLPSEASKFRFRFSHLDSWLKLYVKRYCYSELIGGSGFLTTTNVRLANSLSRADRYISEHGYHSLDDLASQHVFEGVWASLLMNHNNDGIDNDRFPSSVVFLQARTRPFWVDLSIYFGSPLYVPPVAPHKHITPLEIGLDKSKLIPDEVLSQLINRLALHRDGKSRLNRFDHLRLCVLLLLICLGRRVAELLSTPRGEGEDGPLVRYPCRGREGEESDALWFLMRPNKGGPSEYVYISPAWENLATYCVLQLINYSDELRHLAAPEEKHLLILVSGRNGTAGQKSKAAASSYTEDDFDSTGESSVTPRSHDAHRKKLTTGLSYYSFCQWLNGKANPGHPEYNISGVLEVWGVSEDGSAGGPIYKLKTNYGRHTRQSAIAADPQISFTTRQRDLNHRHADMQFAYQHVVEEQNVALMSKVLRSPLFGQSDEWLNDALGISRGDEESSSPSKYRLGLVQLLTPRWLKLLEGNPLYLEPNRVPLGLCEEDCPEDCLTHQSKNKVKVRNLSKDVSLTNDSKAVQEKGNEIKGRSRQYKKKTGSSVVKYDAQPAVNTTPATRTEDVLNRLRERRKRVEENGGGAVK
jgi:hypothetical protein